MEKEWIWIVKIKEIKKKDSGNRKGKEREREWMREYKSWKEGPNKKRNGEKAREIKRGTKVTVRNKERKNWNREKVWRNERERKGRKCHDKLTGKESEQKHWKWEEAK